MMTITELANSIAGFQNVCYSGGAAGADRLFGLWAALNDHEQIHFSFAKHKYHVDCNTVLDIPQYILSDISIQERLHTANKKLKRKVPPTGNYVYNLLARNYFQIIKSERVYCLAKITSPDEIDGGTAWAVQMFIDSCENPEIYVYNLLDNKPYVYDCSTKTFKEVLEVPTPHGRWTGIGSRSATKLDMDSFTQYFK
ncbi:hypothetical protein AAGG91_003002 [Salmonella enterica]|uniref:hypothetical protein n=1 Tax=Salmonella enterica TaxID=28901 RepID=UPI0028F5CCEA|nr:hypothetical protein [Salmonella enterica]ELL7856625.1 hypothetical protein [Salmonella enterica]EME3783203.1 hypothetical protein [Salmonella enterica]MCP0435732.1 hypothetical protein [Salmonella enterica subsp. enterica serovar Mbandaka]